VKYQMNKLVQIILVVMLVFSVGCATVPNTRTQTAADEHTLVETDESEENEIEDEASEEEEEEQTERRSSRRLLMPVLVGLITIFIAGIAIKSMN